MLMTRKHTTYWEEWAAAVGEGWNSFWFARAASKPLALVRIMTGLLAVVYFLSFTSDLQRWFAPDGLLPWDSVVRLTGGNERAFHFSLLTYASSPSELYAVHVVGIVAALCLAAGLFSRISAGVTLAIMLSYVHRAPMIGGLAEPVLAPLLFYLCIAPSGDWFGINAWFNRRKTSDDPQPTVLANFVLRMIQVHLAALVFMMGMSKLSSDPWWTGEAIWNILAQTRSRPVNLSFLHGATFLMNFWTHAIVAFEFAFPILIWNRFARPVLLICGVIVWLSIALAGGHLLFAFAMIGASLAFLNLDGDEPAEFSLTK